MSQAAQDLRAAARYIDEHGHVKGMAIYRTTGAVCALGSIGMVTDENAELAYSSEGHSNRFDAAARVLKLWLRHNGERFPSVPAWNDRKDTTKADVTAGLEKAAAWIEEQA